MHGTAVALKPAPLPLPRPLPLPLHRRGAGGGAQLAAVALLARRGPRLPAPADDRFAAVKLSLRSYGGCSLGIRAYNEEPKSGPVASFFKKVQGGLPIVGLLSRLFSDEGGVGTDRLRYSEFCSRIDKNLSQEAAKAMMELEARHGKMARKQVLLFWCWAAAVGAGLIKSEEIMTGAKRMRASMDMEYELDRLDMLMDEGLQRRTKAGLALPDVPMLARAQKALEAVCMCCLGSRSVTLADSILLERALAGVFPSVERESISSIVNLIVVPPDAAELEQPNSGIGATGNS